MKREVLIKGLKIAAGSAVAIFIAEALGLEYATSTGIITLLTIQNTKRATLQLSVYRVLSFSFAMLFAGIMSALLGFHALGYGCFMLLLTLVSYFLGWGDTLSTNAVFGTHLFMMGKAMSIGFVMNEFALLVLGTGAAILLNWRMPDKERELQEALADAEHEMKQIILDMSEQMMSGAHGVEARIDELTHRLEKAYQTALDNRDNTLKEHSDFYIYYFELRQDQCVVLRHFCHSVMALEQLPYTAEYISGFLFDTGTHFSVENDLTPRLEQMRELFQFFKAERLPGDRAEFEARAILFYGLKELEEFFQLKLDFIDRLSHEQKELYMAHRAKQVRA